MRTIGGLIAILAGFSSALAHAAMVLTLQGKLKAFDEKTLTIEDSHFVYVIKKEALSPGQRKYVKSLQTGKTISLTVDRTAITQVADRQK